MASTASCPLPPADFAQRTLPLIELNLAAIELFRIHRTAYGPLFYNRRSSSPTVFRFDAPGDEFGVLYAAPTVSACIFETLIRNLYENGTLPLYLGESELACRSISSIGMLDARALRLADFTQSLAPLGGNAIVMSIDDYAFPNAWSLAVHHHPANVDGIYFRSRYSSEPCVALFDRCPLVARGGPTPLLAAPGVEEFIDKHQIVLL